MTAMNPLVQAILRQRNPLLGLTPTQQLGLAPGQIAPGNINLNNRPVVPNLDGSISTVRSITVTGPDGHAYLIPTVIADPRFPGGGRVVSDQQAIQQFLKTRQQLGVFRNENTADRYAQTLHEDQAREYLPKPKPHVSPLARAASGKPLT